jgi:hypothetical protein
MIWTRRTSTDEQRQRSMFAIRHKLRDEEVKTDPRYSGMDYPVKISATPVSDSLTCTPKRVSQLRTPHQEGVDRSAEPATVALHLTAALESINGRD